MSQHYQFSADDSVSVKQQSHFREPLWKIRGFEIRGAISKKNGGVLRYEPIVQKREQTKGLKL